MAIEHPGQAAHVPSFRLGDWNVDPKACLVSCGDTVIKLRPQLMDVLVCLARRAGKIVLKDELLHEVWPGQFIAESGLSRCVAELRQILQDDAQQPRYIETVMKRGYRLLAPVVWVPIQEDVAREAGGPSPEAGEPAGHAAPAPEVVTAERTIRPAFGRRGMWAGVAVLMVGVVIVGVVMLKRAPARILTDRDPVVLAFENTTGDAVFDETIPLAVSIQLEQSPFLALLSPARVQEVLGMMRRPPDTAITRAIGLEICERAGARAVIVTSIARIGSQYVIGLEAIACGAGTVLARQQATTAHKEQVLAGLQRAAGEIRLAVGEPAASLEQYQLPIVEATTVSLEALRAVRRGDVAGARGQRELAPSMYRQAVALDPDFALAHARLARHTIGTESAGALRKAWELRQRVTLPERLEIEVLYHGMVTGDVARIVEALELLRQSYPRRAQVRRDLASVYLNSGRYEAAVTEAREALRLEPDSAPSLSRVSRALIYVNRIPEARALMEKAIAAGTASDEMHRGLFLCAVLTNDAALLARERTWAAEHPDVPVLFSAEAQESLTEGRLADAIAWLKKLEAWAVANDSANGPGEVRLLVARYEALCGLTQRAVRRVEAELPRGLQWGAKVDAVSALVPAGRLDEAERLLNEIERETPLGEWRATMVRTYRAAIAAGRGDTRQALELLAPVQPREVGYAYILTPLFVRAQTHYRAGDWANARAAFEKLLAHAMIDSGRDYLPFARLGLARTLARAGDIAASRRAYDEFFQSWSHADRDLPVLTDARREYAALPK